MQPVINPYESPHGIELARTEPPEDKLLATLRGPSMGLIVLAGMHVFNLVLSVPMLVLSLAAGERDLLKPALIAVISVPSVFILFAAIRMRQMRSLKLCVSVR